jgi:hypothetical protein
MLHDLNLAFPGGFSSAMMRGYAVGLRHAKMFSSLSGRLR